MSKATAWRPEELEHLKNVVIEVTSSGGTKTDAFKRFALENGQRTESAARYQWITMCCVSESSAAPLHVHIEESRRKHHKGSGVVRTASVRARTMPQDTETIHPSILLRNIEQVLNEHTRLKMELQNAAQEIRKLTKVKEELEQRNKIYLKAFQSLRKYVPFPESGTTGSSYD